MIFVAPGRGKRTAWRRCLHGGPERGPQRRGRQARETLNNSPTALRAAPRLRKRCRGEAHRSGKAGCLCEWRNAADAPGCRTTADARPSGLRAVRGSGVPVSALRPLDVASRRLRERALVRTHPAGALIHSPPALRATAAIRGSRAGARRVAQGKLVTFPGGATQPMRRDAGPRQTRAPRGLRARAGANWSALLLDCAARSGQDSRRPVAQFRSDLLRPPHSPFAPPAHYATRIPQARHEEFPWRSKPSCTRSRTGSSRSR